MDLKKNFEDMLGSTKPLEEDGVAGTTTAAIPVKVVVTKEMQKEYTDKNKGIGETLDTQTIVAKVTRPAMSSIVIPVKRKSFLECLGDSLLLKVE